MNKRIRALAELCWDKRLDGVHFDIEMFAKLVIGHCCPERPWVGLTDDDKEGFWKADEMTMEEWDTLFNEIEDVLKEKNT